MCRCSCGCNNGNNTNNCACEVKKNPCFEAGFKEGHKVGFINGVASANAQNNCCCNNSCGCCNNNCRCCNPCKNTRCCGC